MLRKMRRKDKGLTQEQIIEVLTGGEQGVLATVGDDSYPYAVPLNYAYHKGCIYFHCAREGHKIDNLNHNPKVSFCVVGKTEIIPEDFSTQFKSVVLFGIAEEVFDAEKKEGLMALIHRFSGDHVAAGEKYIKNASDKTRVFKINIEHMSGKGNR